MCPNKHFIGGLANHSLLVSHCSPSDASRACFRTVLHVLLLLFLGFQVLSRPQSGLLNCSQVMGLHCVSASVDVGNAVLTASSALLSALGTVAAISKQSKAAAGPVQHVKSSPSKLTAAAFDRIVASLPDQVGCTISYISLVQLLHRKQPRSLDK